MVFKWQKATQEMTTSFAVNLLLTCEGQNSDKAECMAVLEFVRNERNRAVKLAHETQKSLNYFNACMSVVQTCMPVSMKFTVRL